MGVCACVICSTRVTDTTWNSAPSGNFEPSSRPARQRHLGTNSLQFSPIRGRPAFRTRRVSSLARRSYSTSYPGLPAKDRQHLVTRRTLLMHQKRDRPQMRSVCFSCDGLIGPPKAACRDEALQTCIRRREICPPASARVFCFQ